MKIIGYSPLGTGSIAFTLKQKELLETIAKKYQVSIYSIILNFLIKRANNIILIPNSMNKDNINANIKSQFLKISKKEYNQIDNSFKFKIKKIRLKNINYADKNYDKIRNINDAINNKYNFTPSPYDLSKKIKKGEELKPIKVRKIKNRHYLIEGRLRFWAHVIAFGWDFKIEAVVKN